MKVFCFADVEDFSGFVFELVDTRGVWEGGRVVHKGDNMEILGGVKVVILGKTVYFKRIIQ